ncbi:hypothetical protein A2U01_0008202 [Trifolium medium]|uniref:Uncharacterized protein n=1 Tax=Trifolium medium TaxID=97028 RepID=A0A392MM16_9FABA|nr:hypothetical protein [Trifolium medium]
MGTAFGAPCTGFGAPCADPVCRDCLWRTVLSHRAQILSAGTAFGAPCAGSGTPCAGYNSAAILC